MTEKDTTMVTNPPNFVIEGQEDIFRQASTYDFRKVLDIGAGNFAASSRFHENGCEVTATGFAFDSYTAFRPSGVELLENVDVCAMPEIADETFDAVWCGHVIEHTLNTGSALAEIRRVLKPDGLLFLMVPRFKHAVVGGHVTPGWNLGILMYVLIMTGFDVKNGSFVHHGYNLTAFCKRGEIPTEDLRCDTGDIETLAHRFPAEIDARHGFHGDLSSVNWQWRVEPSLRHRSLPQRVYSRVKRTFRR